MVRSLATAAVDTVKPASLDWQPNNYIELLRNSLDPQQLTMLDDLGYFHVSGPRTGRVYRIHDNGEVTGLCTSVRALPKRDANGNLLKRQPLQTGLGQAYVKKLAIEADEAYFLKHCG